MKKFNKFTNKNVGNPGLTRPWGGGGLLLVCTLLLLNSTWAATSYSPFPKFGLFLNESDTTTLAPFTFGRNWAKEGMLGPCVISLDSTDHAIWCPKMFPLDDPLLTIVPGHIIEGNWRISDLDKNQDGYGGYSTVVGFDSASDLQGSDLFLATIGYWHEVMISGGYDPLAALKGAWDHVNQIWYWVTGDDSLELSAGNLIIVANKLSDVDYELWFLSGVRNSFELLRVDYEALRETISEKDDLIQSLQSELDGRGAIEQGFLNAIEEKDALIQSLQKDINDRDAFILSLQENMEEKDADIQELDLMEKNNKKWLKLTGCVAAGFAGLSAWLLCRRNNSCPIFKLEL